MLSALVLSAAVMLSAPVVEPVNRVPGTIYIGDSRFNGMDMYTNKGEGFVVAKDSMGYSWLTRTALYEVDRIKAENPDIESWTIVSNLGVNDLDNCQHYINQFSKLKEAGDRVVIVSVNPTEGKRKQLNTKIDEFNKAMSESDLEYLDLNSHLKEVGYDTSDGVHYMKNSSIEIWNEINAYLLDEGTTEYDDWYCLRDELDNP